MPRIFRRDNNNISKVRAPKELSRLIEDEIIAFFDVSYLNVFILNDSKTEYILGRSIARVEGTHRAVRHRNLGLQDPVIEYLVNTKEAFLTTEVNKAIAFELMEDRRTYLFSLRNRLIELGAEACVPFFLEDKLEIVFVLGKKKSEEEFSVREIELFSSLVDQSARVNYKFDLLKREIELFIKSIRKINDDLEIKDPYTRGHSDRVTQFSVIVGSKMPEELQKIPYGEISLYYAAEFHDVGKIKVPDNILKKPSALTDEEYKIIKEHPYESMRMINAIEKWFGKGVLDAVLYHHQNYNGSGYPGGKKGDQINIIARILRVTDSFDAMISDRPYRKGMTHEKALSEIEKGRDSLYDPKVIDAFLDAYREGLFKDVLSSLQEISEADTF
jgi:HD-GYP domain-containing protein (c-di-GMP phosphodiesterase class II)